jgi:2-polyprenyl-6-methoxyphenol hydroxylase-like FAD-dependent oxidoreductase
MTKRLSTTCCIAGGGPAGIMLGYLLARNGIEVTVLEKWPDFFRDFRGDTIHPSTMDILNQLGLIKKFLKNPHNETKQIGVHIGGQEVIIADFTYLHTICPFLGFMPQWDFLNFISNEAKQYPSFHLMMDTEVIDLIQENEKVVGVRAKDKNISYEIRAELVVGADGRHSVVREKAVLKVIDLGAPIDVLWFRLSRENDGTDRSFGFVDRGQIAILIDRDDYWQCAFIIHKGDFEKIKAKGLPTFQTNLTKLVPIFSKNVHELKSWDQVKLLSVAVDHLEQWYQPGLLCIGDAAHAMSPVGGVGINLAVQDAVAAANRLIQAFHRKDGIKISDLAAIQSRRAWPTRVIQKVQVAIHANILEKALANPKHLDKAPWQLRLFNIFPYLRRLPAWLVGIGLRKERYKGDIMV